MWDIKKVYMQVPVMSITRFKIATSYGLSHTSGSRVNSCLKIAIQSNEKELYLHLDKVCLRSFLIQVH